MTEWGVVGVLVVLVGLVSAIVGPVIKLNTSITKLTVTLDNNCADITETRDKIEAVERRGAEGRQRLWKKNEEQDAKIAQQDKRIHVLEGRQG